MARSNLSDNAMNSLYEMNLEELFLEETEELERLSGGPYHREYTPLEEFPGTIMDMEAMIDVRRAPAQAEELTQEECFPAPHDLLPFHAIMGAVIGDDVTQPCFSSFLSEKTQVKITYHQGRRIVSPKKKIFT